ncbi:MAG: hypothetical protein IJP27_03340 [Clostridia bacterium]|nr:hypothetical protein [Clostridia bacterium]
MEKQTREKIENFWYYYKWYVIGGIVLLITLIVGVRSCTLKKNPDLYVLYAVDTSPNALVVEELGAWLGTMTEDLNEDGETTAKVMATTTIDQWNGYNTAAMLVQANSGQAVLYILTENTYKTLSENGMLQQLSGESPYLQGDRYALSASGVLDAVPGIAYETETGESPTYYLAIRKVAGTTHEGKQDYMDQERLAKAMLQKLIAAEEQ